MSTFYTRSKLDRSLISDVKLLKVPLSIGDMTIGVAIKTQAGIIEWDASPIGTTTGEYDPISFKSNKAEQIFTNLRRFLIGKSILNQEKIDEGIVNILGETDTGIKGANLSIATSCAIARAASVYKQKPLYLYISEIYNTSPKIPLFMYNVLGGGGHHKNRMSITELMIMPKKDKKISIEKIIKLRTELFKHIRKIDKTIKIGIEGCLVTQKLSDREAIATLIELLKKTHLDESIELGIDFAARQSKDQYIEDLLNTFPEILYIEDPFPIHEEEKYAQIIKKFPHKFIAGDDITVGNRKMIKNAINKKIINAVVIKLNHAGTITRISKSVEIASKKGVMKVCSQRSRETAKDTLSHIALAFGFNYLKNGSPIRERIVNYSNIIALSSFFKDRDNYIT